MRMFNLHGTEKEKEDEESSEEESDDEEEEMKKPQMELAMMPHYGGINRVRVCLVPFSKQALMSCLRIPISMFSCGISGDPAWRAVVGCRVVGERTGRNI